MNVKRAAVYVLAAWISSFIIVEGVIMYSGSQHIKFADSDADYLLILGAGLKGEEPQPLLMSRLEKAVQYFKSDSHIKIIVSGGKGPGEAVSEAEAMKKYLLAHQFKESQITIEDKSTSTYENIVFTKKLLQQIDGRKNIKMIILTNDFHIFRAKAIAKRQGFNVSCLAVKTPKSEKIYYYTREYFAVVKTFIVDPVQRLITD